MVVLLVFSCIGCKNSNTGSKELDQWDYFSEFVEYSLYTTDETHKDYNWGQGWGVIRDTVYLSYSIKRISSSISIVRSLYELKIMVTENIHKIELQSFEIDVLSVATDEIRWDMYFGSTFIKDVEVNTIAGELVTLDSGFIGDLKWDTGSKLAIFIRLKEPNLVEPYTLKNLKMNIERK